MKSTQPPTWEDWAASDGPGGWRSISSPQNRKPSISILKFWTIALCVCAMPTVGYIVWITIACILSGPLCGGRDALETVLMVFLLGAASFAAAVIVSVTCLSWAWISR